MDKLTDREFVVLVRDLISSTGMENAQQLRAALKNLLRRHEQEPPNALKNWTSENKSTPASADDAQIAGYIYEGTELRQEAANYGESEYDNPHAPIGKGEFLAPD